jgi:hypothetical protein
LRGRNGKLDNVRNVDNVRKSESVDALRRSNGYKKPELEPVPELSLSTTP